MASDRARVSYDPSRHWRGVISQQGRVTLEADWNEAGAIAAAEIRADLIDVIGPSGTPDDGYRIIPATDAGGTPNGDLTIQHGTLYVGGERMVLETDLDYADQPDWVDTEGDPLWVTPAVPDGNETEAVYLLLREQEVGAAEDPALLDIALGGPDTAARRRIVQRVVQHSTKAQNCADALSDLEQMWATEGLTFDPATMRLESTAELQVSFNQAPSAPTPCEPVAQGGYLGAENQLIRVQVASVDESGVPTLVWGYDNAFFLYRIAGFIVDEAGGTTTLTLKSAPVDVYHQPAKDQAVEVLEAAARIGSGDVDFIAAPTGIVTTVASAYDPDRMQLVIATPLAAPTTGSPLLFLRVWQDTIAVTDAGPVALGDTGVAVTLTASGGIFHVGDYWTFAVRPRTPAGVAPVYPERILDAPQPPNGPLEWACELGLVARKSGTATVTDCRHHFDDLVTLTGEKTGGCCCTVSVSPADVDGGAKLQALVDRYARQGPATICLQPGVYTLPAPLVIHSHFTGLTIQGCGGRVRLEASQNPAATFGLSLVRVEEANGFTLRELELAVPLVSHPLASSVFAGLPEGRRQLLGAYSKDLHVSIGVYLLGGSHISIEKCAFSFEEQLSANVFGAGVFAAGAIDGLDVVDCSFTAPEADTLPFSKLATGGQVAPPFQVRFGYLQVPAPAFPSLADATFERNVFDGLTVPVLVIGGMGTTRVADNTVRRCYGGFWLLAASDIKIVVLLDRLEAGDAEARKVLVAQGLTALADPVLLIATATARVLPSEAPSGGGTGAPGSIALPTTAALGAALSMFQPLSAAAAPPAAPADPAAPAAPTAPGAPGAIPAAITGMFVDPGAVDLGAHVPAADPGTAVVPRLEVSANQVDAVIADADSGAGLFVLAMDANHRSSLVCGGNRIRSRVPFGATVSLQLLAACTITGNIVSNEIVKDDSALSLVLHPSVQQKSAPAVAITGNVLLGAVKLPVRPFAAPLNAWDVLNTVGQYLG